MTTEPAAPDSTTADYHATLQRDALRPAAVPTAAQPDWHAQDLELVKAIRLLEEAREHYSRSGSQKPFYEFIRIVLTTKEPK